MNNYQTMGMREWGLLVGLSIIWGGSFFFSKIALVELPTFTIVLLRVGLGAGGLFIYLKATRRPIPTSLHVWSAFFIMGLLNNLLPFSLIVWAQTEIPSGLASILNATTPIFSILVAHTFTSDEKMSTLKVVGVLLGLAGVSVLLEPHLANLYTATSLALLACLGAALSNGIAGVFGRRFRKLQIPAATVAFGQTLATSIMLLPISLIFDRPWLLSFPSTPVFLALLALGLVSTALAYIIFFHILAVGGALNGALVTLLIPVSAILLGFFFLGETLEVRHFLGMAFIACGLVVLDGRLPNLVRRRAIPGNP